MDKIYGIYTDIDSLYFSYLIVNLILEVLMLMKQHKNYEKRHSLYFSGVHHLEIDLC